jgi:hypothetical protein
VNIYGPGKEHQDSHQTSAKGHFGSFVYCLPTEFEGGAFVMRTPKGGGKRFDWATKFAMTTNQSMKGTSATAATTILLQPSVEYVAFTSD